MSTMLLQVDTLKRGLNITFIGKRKSFSAFNTLLCIKSLLLSLECHNTVLFLCYNSSDESWAVVVL